MIFFMKNGKSARVKDSTIYIPQVSMDSFTPSYPVRDPRTD